MKNNEIRTRIRVCNQQIIFPATDPSGSVAGTKDTVNWHCLVEQNPETASGFASDSTVDRLLGTIAVLEEWRETRSTVEVEIFIKYIMANQDSLIEPETCSTPVIHGSR